RRRVGHRSALHLELRARGATGGSGRRARRVRAEQLAGVPVLRHRHAPVRLGRAVRVAQAGFLGRPPCIRRRPRHCPADDDAALADAPARARAGAGTRSGKGDSAPGARGARAAAAASRQPRPLTIDATRSSHAPALSDGERSPCACKSSARAQTSSVSRCTVGSTTSVETLAPRPPSPRPDLEAFAMRSPYRLALAALLVFVALWVAACSKNDKSTNPPPPGAELNSGQLAAGKVFQHTF